MEFVRPEIVQLLKLLPTVDNPKMIPSTTSSPLPGYSFGDFQTPPECSE